MNRTYNILYKHYIDKSTNTNNIDFDNIETIINHSSNHINASYLNYLTHEEAVNNINILLNKLKPGGILSLSIFDIKKYTHNFILNKVSGNDLLNKITNYKSLLSIEDIYTTLDYNINKILQIENIDNKINIVIERTKI